jgi:hypothetical protein
MKIRRPTTVALGVQGSYVVLYNDGTIVFDLRGQYRMVETMIRNTQEAARRRGVMVRHPLAFLFFFTANHFP